MAIMTRDISELVGAVRLAKTAYLALREEYADASKTANDIRRRMEQAQVSVDAAQKALLAYVDGSTT